MEVEDSDTGSDNGNLQLLAVTVIALYLQLQLLAIGLYNVHVCATCYVTCQQSCSIKISVGFDRLLSVCADSRAHMSAYTVSTLMMSQ
jgi:hypothetical protein